MRVNEFLVPQDQRLKELREEYQRRLEAICHLQHHIEIQQRDLFTFIAEHQEDFNRLYD